MSCTAKQNGAQGDKSKRTKRNESGSCGTESPTERNEKRARRTQQSPSQSSSQVLDSSSSVAATHFAARRLPEIKSLWHSLFPQKLLSASANEPTESSRHLRRRTVSRCQKRRHRFPAADGPDASESKCRKARRKPRSLQQAHNAWHDPPSSGLNWLETHLWHVKRFHVSPLHFRWSVPLYHTNRGTSASLRLSQTKCTVQDATWTVGGQFLVLEFNSSQHLISALHPLFPTVRWKDMDQFVFMSGRPMMTESVMMYDSIHFVFPNGAIGPATLLLGAHRNAEEEEKALFWVKIAVPPSILHQVERLLMHLVAANQGVLTTRSEGLALIRVRGHYATRAITTALSPRSSMATAYDWNKIQKCYSTAHKLLTHGTAIPVEIGLDNLSNSDGSSFVHSSGVVGGAHHKIQKHETTKNEMKDEDALRAYIAEKQVYKDDTQNHIPIYNNNGNNIVLVSHRPSNLDASLPHNEAVCGWDILVSSLQWTKILFLALVHNGGACPIGLAEDARACMEAEPPLPLWPRDYPDTNVGKAYWSSSDGDWNLVRYIFEECSGGRISTVAKRMERDWMRNRDKSHHPAPASNGDDSIAVMKPMETTGDTDMKKEEKGQGVELGGSRYKFQPIQWDEFTHFPYAPTCSEDCELKPSNVLVVRGIYMDPFLQAMAGSGIRDAPIISTNKRRPRRKIRSRNETIRSPPLPNELAIAHSNTCHTLLSSLSLPALLRCHVVMDTKGTFPRSGAAIYEYDHFTWCTHHESINNNELTKNDIPNDATHQCLEALLMIGRVVGGAFSPSRGKYHGVGFIGSKRFLHCLGKRGTGSAVYLSDATRQKKKIAMQVMLVRGGESNKIRLATLSLLLN